MGRDLATMTWTEIRDLDKRSGAVVLPIGSLEQHGPHLSIDTDLHLAERFLALALERLPAAVPLWRLPLLPVSKSNEHVGFPGSFWLSGPTLIAVLTDIARSTAASGFRRLVLWTCHGGNRALLEVVARDIRAATGLMVFSVFPPALAADPIPMAAADRRFDLHAGDWETSVMMALSPERVRPDRLDAALPDLRARTVDLEFTGATVAWLTRDLSATGTLGNATTATAERGRTRLPGVIEALVAVLTEIADFEMPVGAPEAAAP